MYYFKVETLSNCVYIRLDNEIIARVFFHDYNTDEEAIASAEKITNLLNQ
jgi:hypothetical protein